MTTVSGCTLVRNAVKLKYPLEASILTYYPLCDEVVIAYDPTTGDGTDAFIKDLCRKYAKLRAVPNPWNMKNHEGGTEITIQSNVAAAACTSDWILYVQADEAIHEADYDLLRHAIGDTRVNGVLFSRRSFLGTLDREIPEYYAQNLLRLYRNGKGCVIGDGMTCGLFQGVRPSLFEKQFRMFNYSRMGDREEVLLRSKCRDTFHISTEEAIEANVASEYTQRVVTFDPESHPRPIREFYKQHPAPFSVQVAASWPVTLSLLLGPGERENLVPFLWQFRNWPGDVVILDDMTSDGGRPVLEKLLAEHLGLPSNRYKILRAPLQGDFGAARTLLQDAAGSPWVLTTAPDERWEPSLVAGLPKLAAQLDRDQKLICGFPRANFVDGILVNDIPDTQWTSEGLLSALPRTIWPPRNPDVQHRLMRKEERWLGRIHEHPARLSTHASQVVVLSDYWILHNKSYQRQRKQDSLYKSLGQRRGMPPASESPTNFREATLREILHRLPGGRVVAVETGTLRDGSAEARLSDGWSTYAIAACLAERREGSGILYSIDLSPDCIGISKRTVPSELHSFVSWICGDAAQVIRTLQAETIDFLYLDSSDDPRQILAEFEAAQDKLAPHSIVVVDDTGPYHAGPNGKGTLVIPEAEARGWHSERRDNDRCHMTILTRASKAVGRILESVLPLAPRKGWAWFR